MSNLDSIVKSNITLPTKVRLVKAMVFPVVMYGCESWTAKKAEHQRIDAPPQLEKNHIVPYSSQDAAIAATASQKKSYVPS